MKNITDAQICEALIHVLTTDFEKDITIDGITVGHIIRWLKKRATRESVDVIVTKPEKKQTPKFKVGDWVVNHVGNIRQIIDIKENCYYYIRLECSDTIENPWHSPIDYVDEQWHEWSIEDAKPGDVLVNGSNIFIFHFINGTRLMGCCHVNIDDGRFYDDLGKYECFCLIDAIVTPATNEQRDLLFAKMNEAGYMWDDEKKELKKSSKNPLIRLNQSSRLEIGLLTGILFCILPIWTMGSISLKIAMMLYLS